MVDFLSILGLVSIPSGTLMLAGSIVGSYILMALAPIVFLGGVFGLGIGGALESLDRLVKTD